MHILKLDATPQRRSDTLMILLPGAWQAPDDFLENGFAAALHEGMRGADIWLPALAPQAMESADALARLDAEVMLPARAAGYRIWLAGISMGGLLALGAAALDPTSLAGVCLLAPYPGNRLLTREIAAAGGPARWSGGAEDDDERRVWRWLGQQRELPLYLGFGRDDRFADGLELMAATLPPARVERIAGGHDWPTWSRLWPRMLATIKREQP
ncbi:hypothetical protein [Paludibacterium yongneupense]|uniref:hypothetical protein n=1 Tax=Paludibacterium yongneupense TaxID=400061 RepID=UPI000412D764|nr:hypothetical protein [Paludibacterium yongneupense]